MTTPYTDDGTWEYDPVSGGYVQTGVPAMTSTDASGNTVLVGAGGSMVINDVGLFGASPSASAATNTAAIQAALDLGGLVTITTPGNYEIAGGSDPQSVLLIPSDTEFYIGPGVVLDNIQGESALSKTALSNANATSNFVAVQSISFTTDAEWYRIVTVNIGSAANPFSVGGYVYIRPAYTSGDTTKFWNYVYRVLSVDNSDTNNKVFTFEISYQTHGSIPTLTGDLIVYPADANIKVHGGGAIRQRVQNRGVIGDGATVYSRGSFIQGLFNKVLNCYADIQLTDSPGSTSIALANAFNCIIENCSARVANGITIYGNVYGAQVIGVAGESKDDLITIFPDGSGYPFYDADGTTVNSKGPVDGVLIDFRKKIHKNCHSNGVSMMSEEGTLIDNIMITNYVGTNLLGGPANFRNFYDVYGGNGAFGTVTFKDCTYYPRKDKGFFGITTMASSTVTVRKIVFDNVNIVAGSIDGCAGLCSGAGQAASLMAIQTTATDVTIGEIVIKNCDIRADTTANATTDMDLIRLPANTYVGKVSILDSKLVATGTNKAMSILTINGATGSKGVGELTVSNTEVGAPYKSFAIFNSAGVAPVVRIDGCRIVHTSQNGFIHGELPTGSDVTIVNSDYSQCLYGACYIYGANALTNTFRFGATKGGTKRLLHHGSGTNKTFNIYSMGGNVATTHSLGGAGNVWNFLGCCADIKVDITAAARTDGAIIYNTNAAAGTLAAAGLVVGQGTAANSWHLMADPTKVY